MTNLGFRSLPKHLQMHFPNRHRGAHCMQQQLRASSYFGRSCRYNSPKSNMASKPGLIGKTKLSLLFLASTLFAKMLLFPFPRKGFLYGIILGGESILISKKQSNQFGSAKTNEPSFAFFCS